MQSLRFYLLVAVCGAVLMAQEILSSRLLSPHFGNSVYVWGSIISVFLAALALGYAVGGRLADRHPSLTALAEVVLLAAACQAGLLVAGETLAATLGRATGGSPAGTLLATSVLFGPSTVLLGMVSPWAVRLAAQDLGRLGHLAGRLYAVSTAGSLLGTLVCTFGLIPFLGLRRILAILLVATAASAGLAFVGATRRALVPAAGTVALLGFGVLHLGPAPAPAGALYRRITPYQTLQVIERDGVRYLESDRVVQSGIRIADGRPAISYCRLTPAALLLKPQIHDVLMLGLGAGGCATVLREARPDVHVEYVEVDPAVPEVAGRFLGFRLQAGDRLHVDDARRFLETDERKWDLIFADTYIGRAVPFHLATQEFFTLAKARLAPDGVLGINLAGGLSYPFSRAIVRTLSELFPQLYAFEAPRRSNVVVFASGSAAASPTATELAERARALDAGLGLELPLTKIVADQARSLEADLLSAPLLTDAYAPVERLVNLSAGEMPRRRDPAPGNHPPP